MQQFRGDKWAQIISVSQNQPSIPESPSVIQLMTVTGPIFYFYTGYPKVMAGGLRN